MKEPTATPESIIVVDPLIDSDVTESRQRFITEPNITPPSSSSSSSEHLDELVEEEKKEKMEITSKKKRNEELSPDPSALGTSQDLSDMMEALAARTSGPSPAAAALPLPAAAAAAPPLSPTLSTSSSKSLSSSSSMSQLVYSNHWKNIVSSSSPTKQQNNHHHNHHTTTTTTSRSRRHSLSASAREERSPSHYAEFDDVTEDMLENAATSLQRMYRGFHYRKKFQEERLQEYILAKNPLTTLFCFLIFLALLVMCCVVETENVQYVFANQLNDWVSRRRRMFCFLSFAFSRGGSSPTHCFLEHAQHTCVFLLFSFFFFFTGCARRIYNGTI
jgi:hypothetical protein